MKATVRFVQLHKKPWSPTRAAAHSPERSARAPPTRRHRGRHQHEFVRRSGGVQHIERRYAEMAKAFKDINNSFF
jgi:hypothetical protein